MSTAEPSLEATVRKDWIEHASDYLNPILVKETRQASKSRSFVSVFILMLIASWLISAIGVLYVYGPELPYAAAGRSFFSAFYAVLAVAVFIVVPQSAFRSIQSERDQQTFEMLTITTLSPRKIIWGKWWSAAVQTIVYYAAIAPFMVFTNLLRGISLPFIAFVLFWSFLTSVSLAMLAIAFSTFTKQRQAFGVLQFLLVFPLVMTLMWGLQLMFIFSGIELPFDQPWFWLAQVIILSFLIPAFVLLRQIATVNLTFEGANRSTGIRWSCLILLLTALGWMLVEAHPGILPFTAAFVLAPTNNEISVWASLLSIWLWLIALFTTTEDERLSRRVRQEAPRRWLWRFLLLPLYPGGGRGFIYFLMCLCLLLGVTFYLVSFVGSSPPDSAAAQKFLLALGSYLLFYIGLTAFLGRAIRRIGSDLHATHARVLGVLVVAAGVIGPFLFVFWSYQYAQAPSPLLMLTNPFWVCWQLLHQTHEAPAYQFVVMMGGVGLLLNVRSMAQGIREFLAISPK